MSEGTKQADLLFKKEHELTCAPIWKASFCVSDLAQWLAGEHDDVQATFFNEFDRQLRRTCDLRGGSHHFQIAFITKQLTEDAKYTLEDLGYRGDK